MRIFHLLTVALAIALPTSGAHAQSQAAQERAEKAVQITQGPNITSTAGTSATITWTTNNVAATQVRYRPSSGGDWKTAYERQGSKEHSLNLTGLTPGQTYEYQILTRDGDVRTSGQFQAGAANVGAAPSAAASSGDKGPIYRGFDASQGAHAFATQQNGLPGGFNPEGIAGYVMRMQAPGTAPLYAMTSSSGDHFYTSDTNERAKALNSGYQDKGILGYAATAPQAGAVPMYRLLNPSSGKHFYTTSDSERAQVLQQGYKDEGVAGYIWAQ